jgi:hypothetical protein
MEFIWVRHFKVVDNITVQQGWSIAHLDQLKFHPIDSPDAFGFVDPGQIMRACHIIPKFVLGKQHENGNNLSNCAKDGEDWQVYYANRQVSSVMVSYSM